MTDPNFKQNLQKYAEVVIKIGVERAAGTARAADAVDR